MSDIVAGIICNIRFLQPNTQKYQVYIDYINRDEAQRNENYMKYSLYNDYMDNPEKTSALFTAENDMLSAEDKVLLKENFIQAQKNGSLMWQPIISFDNRWLEKNGYYSSATNEVNQDKLMELTRKAMSEMSSKENMNGSLLWSAAIHFNTDNIHIHIAAVEPFPTRSRGLLKQNTIDNMKSKIFGCMVDRSAEHIQITDIIRKSIVGSSHDFSKKSSFKEQYEKIYSLLPSDKSRWQYNNRSIAFLRPEIDKLSKMYIQKYHKDEYAELLKKLNEEKQVIAEAFGEGNCKKAELYIDNRLTDMYTRMGNSILKDMKNRNEIEKRSSTKTTLMHSSTTIHRKNKNSIFQKNNSMYLLKKAMKKDFYSIKNQQYFQHLMYEIENEKE